MNNTNTSIKNILVSTLKLVGSILLLGIILNFAFTNKNNKVTAPKIPDKFVLKPTIKFQDKELHSGTAFAAKIDGEKQTVIITSIHVLGKEGGLKKDIPSVKLPKAVKGVSLTDAFSGKNCGTASTLLSIPKADYKAYKNDVAAFLTDKNTNVFPVKISSNMPEDGDIVWLAASNENKKKKLYKATVTESSDSILCFEYADNNLILSATSGAPIVDKKGEIVGINLGYKRDGDKLIGVANPSASFKKMIVKAIKK